MDSRDRETLERIVAAHEADVIERALTAARERLDMDVAYLTRVDDRRQQIDEVSGNSSPLGFEAGTEVPIDRTYCARMLAGEIPNLVPDTRAELTLRDLPATKLIGAYAGVAITLADGTVHGTLCCASGEPRQPLGEEELAFLRVLAGMMAARIDRARDIGAP